MTLHRYSDLPAPAQVTSDTSVEAAFAIEPHINDQEARVLRVLRLAGEYGATNEEIAAATGLRLASVCGRVATLRDEKKLIEDTERTRKTESGRNATVRVVREVAR